MFFIVVLNKDVEGVAIATIASQGVAAVMSLVVLIKGKGFAKLEFMHVRIYKEEFKEILRIGVPTGIQRCMFSLSNVVLTSTLNSFGENVIAANTIAHQFDAIVHDATDAFASASLSFVSQNLGAKNFKRIWKVIWESIALTVCVGLALGLIAIAFSRQLCGIMTDSETVIEYGINRITTLGTFYFITGIMNVFANTLRGLGKPTIAMIGSIICTVCFRVLWIYTIFPLNPTLTTYYAVYPISWLLCALFFAAFAIPTLLKMQKDYENTLNKSVEGE